MDSDEELIEKEFAASWDYMDQFYRRSINDHGNEWLKPILNLIAELRKRGYDKQLRAGPSHWTFVLHRSRKYNPVDESILCIELHPLGGMKLTYQLSRFVKPIEVQDEHIAVTPMMEKLLSLFLTLPIE